MIITLSTYKFWGEGGDDQNGDRYWLQMAVEIVGYLESF